MCKVFISYTGRSQAGDSLARELILRIAAQEVEVWNYQDEFQEILTGSDIQKYCEDELASSDALICILTDEAFSAPYAVGELEYALKNLDIPIFPLLSSPQALTLSHSEWPYPFSELTTLKHKTLVSSQHADLELFLGRDLFPLLKREYRALPVARRIDFAARLQKCLRNEVPLNPEYLKGCYSRCMKKAWEFEGRYSTGDIEGCLRSLRMVIDELEESYAVQTTLAALCYPKALREVVEVEAGGNTAKLAEAIQNLELIVEQHADYLDENVYSAIGNLKLAAGDREGAWAAHIQAYEHLQANGDFFDSFVRRTEADIIHNMLIAAIACQKDLSLTGLPEKLGKLDTARVQPDGEDAVRFDMLRVFVHLYQGEIESGKNRFADILSETETPIAIDLMAELCDLLLRAAEETGRVELADEAVGLLSSVLLNEDGTFVQDAEYLLFAAESCVTAGAVEAAMSFYAMLNGTFNNPEFLIREALLHHALGRSGENISLCRRVLAIGDENVAEPRMRRADWHYYTGFAKYFLGDPDWQRSLTISEYGKSEVYEEVLHRYCGDIE